MKRFARSMDVWLLLLFSGAAAFYTAWRGQDQNWDLLNYHFFTGYSYFSGRASDIAAAGLQTFFHPAVNVIAYLAYSGLPFPYSAWAVLFVQLLSLPAVVVISRQLSTAIGLRKESASRYFALLLCFLSPVWISELGTSFFSSTTTPLILWGMCLLLSDGQRPALRWLLAGVMLGLAVGLKLTNAPFVIAATASVMVLAGGIGRSCLRPFLAYALGGVAGFLLTAGWYWHLWVTWGNPVFPLYNNIFHSPYYDSVNFRDMRWVFNSFGEFLRFLYQVAFVTGKTSEVPFADARFLIAVLLVPLAFWRRAGGAIKAPGKAVLMFFLVGFALWALAFAYQRYLIPAELLFGLVIWVLVVQVVRGERNVLIVMCLLFVGTVALVRIPDWGHGHIENDAARPFDVAIPESIKATPARYLVRGVPVSYILPSLNPQSRFFGLAFSPQVDELISSELQKPSALPVRVLMNTQAAGFGREWLNSLNPSKEPGWLDCTDFWTRIDRYFICEFKSKAAVSMERVSVADIDYSNLRNSHVRGVLSEKGLSIYEPWGRWSDGQQVQWELANCVPKGRVRLELEANAFGPNVDQRFQAFLGEKAADFTLKEARQNVVIEFDNEQDCATTLSLTIPKSTSPKELGMSGDERKLGMSIVRVQVSTAQ